MSRSAPRRGWAHTAQPPPLGRSPFRFRQAAQVGPGTVGQHGLLYTTRRSPQRAQGYTKARRLRRVPSRVVGAARGLISIAMDRPIWRPRWRRAVPESRGGLRRDFSTSRADPSVKSRDFNPYIVRAHSLTRAYIDRVCTTGRRRHGHTCLARLRAGRMTRIFQGMGAAMR